MVMIIVFMIIIKKHRLRTRTSDVILSEEKKQNKCFGRLKIIKLAPNYHKGFMNKPFKKPA